MKKRFDELGITIPFPQLTISYETGKADATTASADKQPERVTAEEAGAAAEKSDTPASEPAKAD